MSLTFVKKIGAVKEQIFGGAMSKDVSPVFTKTQKSTIIFFCVMSLIAPHYLPIDVLLIKHYLLTTSVIMLGFTMTSVSFLINKVDETVKNERGTFFYGMMFGKGINLYGALVKNAQMAMVALLFNVILGIILIILDTQKIKEYLGCFSLNLLESVVLMFIAFAVFYTVCLIFRIFTVITNINVED